MAALLKRRQEVRRVRQKAQRPEKHNKCVDQRGDGRGHTIKRRNGSRWAPRGRRRNDAGVVTDYSRCYRSVSKVTDVEIGVA